VTLAIDIQRFNAMVDAIYEAALRPERWPAVVERITAALDGRAALLFTPLDPVGPRAFVASARLSPETLHQYAERFHAIDIWTQAGVAQNRFTTGTVVSDEELLPRAELLSSAYFQEFLQPAGISRLCTAAIFATEDPELPATVLSIYGGLQAPAFDPIAKETLRLLVPHLSRALGVMYRLHKAEHRVVASLAAIDRIERGIVLLGGDGRVLHVNPRANEILAASRDLEVVDIGVARRLAARDPERDLALQRWLADALSSTTMCTDHFLAGLSLPRGNRLTPLYLSASRLAAHNPYGAHGHVPIAIVFVSEAEAPSRIDREALREIYRLTPAELRLVEGLAAGATLSDMAEAQGLSVQTLRDRLKRVFAKMGVKRQAELVRLALAVGNR
jgi:DNA-binding CsgD family transcriptional regulator/PAS domain-containing protein